LKKIRKLQSYSQYLGLCNDGYKEAVLIFEPLPINNYVLGKISFLIIIILNKRRRAACHFIKKKKT